MGARRGEWYACMPRVMHCMNLPFS
jgi:hypothetical protein